MEKLNLKQLCNNKKNNKIYLTNLLFILKSKNENNPKLTPKNAKIRGFPNSRIIINTKKINNETKIKG